MRKSFIILFSAGIIVAFLTNAFAEETKAKALQGIEVLTGISYKF